MLRSILIAALFVAAGSAHADAIAKQGNDWVRLTLHACDNPRATAAVQATGEHPDAFRAAVAQMGGHEFAACWRPTGGGAYLIYEDGDKGLIPLSELTPTPEA